MQEKSYVILNMSDEKNKGDFAILKSIVDLLRTHNKYSDISVINVDLNETDLLKQNLTRMLKVKQLPALFPKISNRNIFIKAYNYSIDLFLIIIFFLCIAIFQNSLKYFLFIFPKRFKKTFLALEKANKVFLKGGSFLYDYGSLNNSLYFLRMIYLSIISIFLKKDLYILGVSIGPIKSSMNIKLIKFLIKHSRITILRELISYNFINSLSINKDNIFVIPDMAFLAKYDTNINIKDLLSNENIPYPINKIKIAVTAREWEFPQSHSDSINIKSNYISVLTDSLREIQTKYNAILYFIPHNLYDIDFESLIYKSIGKDSYLLKGDYSLEELINFYKNMDYTIGVRLHSCILSLAVKTPALHIAYMMHKGLGTYKLLNLEDYVIDATNFDTELVLSKFELMVKNSKQINNNVNKAIEQSRMILFNNLLKQI